MHLFLSPHFDDVVLSCGGLIHRLTAAGERVLVRTVMGGKPSPERTPDTAIVRDLHARWSAGDDPVETRAQEDEAAVTALGAELKRLLVWTDCVYRVAPSGEALYPTEESLFGEVHSSDIAGKFLPTMVLPPYESVRIIYAPLGAGHHVDHQIVRDWGIELGKQYRWVALKFYEEYPYSQDEGAVVRALDFYKTVQPPMTLQSELVKLGEADVVAKLHAMARYRSQLSTFWADEAAMESATRATLKQVGGGEPAERYWGITNN